MPHEQNLDQLIKDREQRTKMAQEALGAAYTARDGECLDDVEVWHGDDYICLLVYRRGQWFATHNTTSFGPCYTLFESPLDAVTEYRCRVESRRLNRGHRVAP